MVTFRRAEKERRERRSPISALKANHVACPVLLAMIILATLAAPCLAADSTLSLTEAELAFLQKHPVIHIGVDPKFVPFEFIDENGNYKGITADYLALISERTGLHFEVVKGLTWPEAYDMALKGAIDALSAVGKTSEREEHFLLSEPYYYFKRVIVTRDADTSISSMEDLEGMTVAVQRNSSHHSYLLSYPKINLSLYDSVEAALTAVATGTEKALLGNLATTSYLIRTNGLTNLRFVSFEAEKQQALYFAARKDWPELVSIFNKAMNAITDSEKLAISSKWIELDTDFDYSSLIRILLMIGGVIAVIFGISFFWIVQLQKEIRRRKQIQLDLEKAKHEADEANRFKSSFMARMSHEIRTPLNAITGMSYLLKKTEITLTQSMYIDRITQAANNMLSIVNDILDFSKIEAGKVELEITSFSMDQVIQDVVNIISHKIDEQKIGFRLIKDPHVPNWLLGDPKRIEQVLLNVLNNAVKFTTVGEVSLEICLISRENDRYHISFTIKDTGIGMTQEQIDKLFNPFEQGDSSINRRFGGSGLGLSIVKDIVKMMDGEVEVFSTLGEGSTFIIRMSLSLDKEKEAGYLNSLSDNHLKDVRTLVLERSGLNASLVESYLGSFGMKCELVSSESSAISLLEAANGKFAQPFDLFIIDYDTPAEGGFAYVDAMRNDKRIAQAPKLMMLLPMMREDLFDKLNEHGIDMGIGKPIIPSVLLNGIMDALRLKAVIGIQPSTATKPVSEKPEKPYHVLLAEDNRTNQLIATALLQQSGIETIIANDGKEALELYKEHRNGIDLILMDLHMPIMNGYEAAEKIRELSGEVPIVAMTADVILGVRDKCEQSGIFHYISKPFDPERFIQTIKGLIIESEPKKEVSIAVLDRQLGLKNMGGNEELYQQVLIEYRNENQDTLDKLKAALDGNDYAEAIQIVHKAKSSSGSIGAKSLQEAASSLQKALDEKEEDKIALLQDRFSHLLRKLLEELE